MVRVKLNIEEHYERMNVLESLRLNGYECGIETETQYMPPKVTLWVDVKEYDVEDRG